MDDGGENIAVLILQDSEAIFQTLGTRHVFSPLGKLGF